MTASGITYGVLAFIGYVAFGVHVHMKTRKWTPTVEWSLIDSIGAAVVTAIWPALVVIGAIVGTIDGIRIALSRSKP